MGALVAYELTRALLRDGLPGPSWLGVSACNPPVQRFWQANHRRDLLTDDRLRSWLADNGQLPPELLANDELWQLFGPVFRGDFELVDSWRPEQGTGPVPVPVTAFGGNSDPMVGPETLALWSEHTDRFLGTHVYAGAHFYLHSHRQEISRQIVLSTLLAHTYER
jgi:surfactin synthase thioesterase subunit